MTFLAQTRWGGSGGGQTGSDSKCIWKMELMGFPDGLHGEGSREGPKAFSVRH